MALRRLNEGGGSGGGQPAASPVSTRLGVFKTILAHLTETAYEDGGSRQVGWLTVRARGGQWECVLKDPDSSSSLSASASKLDEALALLEQLVGADPAPWQHDPFLAQRKPKKRA